MPWVWRVDGSGPGVSDQGLAQEVSIIRPRAEGGHCLVCPKCAVPLDLAAGEWVAEFPKREIRGYRISQLHSPKVDPGEILEEYRTTRYPDRFYNLKIGIPWANLDRRLDAVSVLGLCGDEPLAELSEEPCVMGVDTGRALHVVILRDHHDAPNRLVHLGECHEFAELDGLIKRFQVDLCVIDGLPETHATREFARRHHRKVYMAFFQQQQRGAPHWDTDALTVTGNRTELLDASRAAVRDSLVVLPRRQPIVEEFAEHMAADAKVLDEDEETGVKKYRYIKTGVNHFSLAFTYAWLAAGSCHSGRGLMRWMRAEVARAREGQGASR